MLWEETNHRETSSPGQDEREGQYEPNFRKNIPETEINALVKLTQEAEPEYKL